MQRFFFICMLAVWAVPAAGQEAAVRTADVYPQGAWVTLEAAARPDMAVDLPLSFEEDSLRVTGQGARILSVDTSRIQRTGWIFPALADLNSRIGKTRSEVDRLEAREASLQQTAKHLQDNVPSSWKPQDLLAFLEAAAKRREQEEREIRENGRALAKARAELSRLEQELSEKLPPEPEAATRVRIKTSGEGIVRIRAWTPQATWSTRYSLDLSGKTGRVTFSQDAAIQQKTGLDWEGDLVLHTVQPRRTLIPPQLPPLVADFRRPQERNDGIAMMMKEAAAPETAGEETLTDLNLRVRGRAPGDGTPARFSVARFALPAETRIVAIPALDREAWLTAEIKSLDRPLLSGAADLFLDGSPTGKTRIGTSGRGENLKLAFGKVPLVTTTAEEAVPVEGTTWGRGKLEKAFVLSVTNGMGTPTAVSLLDRVPVPAQEKIRIEILTLDPKPSKQDDRGILTWDLKLAPGESRKLTVKYRLTYPADQQVIFR
jgi:hypothetical protein